jgi:hypothetical protein
LTDITTTWNESELQPYRALIRAGQADVIMTAHVFHSRLDISYPATLSQRIIKGMLRSDLDYDGVVISDDMQMGAITNYYGFETAILKAIEAGVDIILYANTMPDLAARATETIASLVQSGLVSPQRIDQSYQRIQRLKRMLPGQPVSQPAPAPVMTTDTPGEAYFPATGHTVRGPFLDYWQRRGGLSQFGFPITGEINERGYTVQYFERARFEHYPENAGTLYEVQLSPLGSLLTADRRDEPPFQRTVPDTRPGTFISEAGHHIAPEFVAYWRQGGLLLYGYPISEAFREPDQHDGKTYLVQYFERARFEHHPENAGTAYEVLLGMLGREMLRRRGQEFVP